MPSLGSFGSRIGCVGKANRFKIIHFLDLITCISLDLHISTDLSMRYFLTFNLKVIGPLVRQLVQDAPDCFQMDS
ncbi:Predicted protein [Komagataella phaffii CBS 7435]|nr:Predicted protein [Komagataella phaffii CBS 7435]